MVAVTCSAFPIFCPQSDLPLYPFRCASFTVSGHSCPRTFAWGLIFGSGVIPGKDSNVTRAAWSQRSLCVKKE